MDRYRLISSLGILILLGCSHPLVQGPQLTCLPENFGFDGHFQTTERILPGRHIIEQRGYVEVGREDKANTILIVTISGATTYESLLGTWSTLDDRGGRAEFGPLQPLPVKGHDAWAWRVLWHEDERLIARDLIAVVSDTDADRTYVLKFHASSRDCMDEALMERTLASFQTDSKEQVSVAKLSVAIALAAGFAFVYTRARGTLT